MKTPCSKTVYILLVLLICTLVRPHGTGAQGEEELGNLNEHLRSRLYLIQTYETFHIKGEKLHALDLLMTFYEGRGFQIAWLTEGTLSESGKIFLSLLKEAHLEGLNPGDYHLETIDEIWMELSTEMASVDSYLMVDLDILLTNAFFVYASDLEAGRLHSRTLERAWVKKTTSSLLEVLEVILQNGEEEHFQELKPSHRDYNRLVSIIPSYWEIIQEGGWPQLPEGTRLQEGDQQEAVKTLRLRLSQEPNQRRDLTNQTLDHYDPILKEAVMDFQERYHLEVTGEVNDQTRRMLNIPAENILHQIFINLERWRWFPPHPEERYLLVNLPDYSLKVVERGETVMDMRVIIGHDGQKTPVFNSRISHLVLSPRWYIPTSLAIRSYLPKARDKPEDLEEMRIRVYEKTEGDFEQIDPRGVDWEDVPIDDFPYYFWQDPGPWNRLGNVIFMFPNPYHVYLHDTPDQYLFNRRVRTFSEGCIRIEKPMELALYLLPHQQWSLERIQEIVARRVEHTVFLPQSVPVYIQYCTAWVHEEGMLHLRDDIYQRDRPLKEKFPFFASYGNSQP